MEMVTRCYRYALDPSEAQRQAIFAAAKQARRHWNALVAALRYAEREIEHGRRGSIQSKLVKLWFKRKLVGPSGPKARARAEKDGISFAEAAKLIRIEKVRENAKLIYAKDGRLLRRISMRRLAAIYAETSAETSRQKKKDCNSEISQGLWRKFDDLCQLYIAGQRGAPKFKGSNAPVTLQQKIVLGAPAPLSGTLVNLRLLAGEVCAAVPVVLHRPIPGGAVIKQVAVTIRGEKMYVVFMIIMPAVHYFPSTGAVAGIDPGRKIALAVSDGTQGTVIQPPLSRDSRTLKRLRRLQRKAARQLRAANPQCFNEDKTWKRGARIEHRSNNFKDTSRKVLAIHEHIANARQDFYHNAANAMLNKFDIVGVGNWRGNGNALGRGAARRAGNRKDYDHAISSFTGILKYKATESGNKQFFDVPEHGTTKTCSACGAVSGPTGLEGLSVREWTCSECGTEHHRDFQSAAAIRLRAIEMAADSAVRVASPKGRKKGRCAKARTKAQAPSPTKTIVSRQRESRSDDPETGSGPVAERRSNMVLSGHSRQTDESPIPLAESRHTTESCDIVPASAPQSYGAHEHHAVLLFRQRNVRR